MATEVPHPLPLEDSWFDVLGKAIRGTGIDEKNLAPSANIIPSQLKSILAGERPSEDTLRRLAIAVGLRPTPFLDLAFQRYKPQVFDASKWKGVRPMATRYMDVVVNAYLLWDLQTKEGVLFDTGTDISVIKNVIAQEEIKLSTVCITHAHGDHIAVLSEVMEVFKPKVYGPKSEPVKGAELIEEGKELSVGSLKIKTLLTDGHSAGHLTYVVTSLNGWLAPVVIVGDALFAGSMGAGSVSYERLRSHVQEKILTLPPDSLVCPGHGPTTTIKEEDEHNPFG